MIRAWAPLAPALALACLALPAAAQPTADALPHIESIDLGHGLGVAERTSETAPPGDEWLGRDKAMHFGASFLMTLAGQYVLVDKGTLTNGQALPVAAGAALAVGLAKEVMDGRRERHPHFCWRDLAADAAGVALAAAVVSL